MNIFLLDRDIEACAKAHNDKHVVKQTLEYAQLLSTAHHLCGGHTDVYKPTHKNHPSSLWVREGIENYKFLYTLFCALSHEYTHRYGKVHKSYETLSDKLSDVPSGIPEGQTEIKPVMPEEYVLTCPVDSYRMYYIHDKRDLAKWTNRQQPEWWV